MNESAKKFTTFFLLLALSASFVCAAFSFAKIEVDASEVYCPLTKKLQPVHASKRLARKISLDDFCASDEKKAQFEQALIATHNLISFGEIEFENFAFDFFQNGKIAFKNSPGLPGLPPQNSANSHYAITSAGNFAYQDFTFTVKSGFYDFSQNPRPPTVRAAAKFDFRIARDLEKISQNINPRSPPANLS